MNIKKYQEIVKDNHKEEPIFKDCFFAFLSGGIIGLIGQGLFDIYSKFLSIKSDEALALMSMSVVFVSS